jgi:site-specific recombinase XerD
VQEIERAFAIALELAGIMKPLTPHSIRHTVGSWLTIAGVPEVHVAEVLGHKRRSVTSGYSHLTPTSLGPVMEKLVSIERDGLPDHSQKRSQSKNAIERNQ